MRFLSVFLLAAALPSASGAFGAASAPPMDVIGARAQAQRNAVPLLTMDPVAWAREQQQGFRPLFNGKSLQGWMPVNTTASQWASGGGVLNYLGGGKGWLRTETTYDNFILRLEWRQLTSGGDAGITLRSARDGSPFPESAHQIKMGDGEDAGSLLMGGLNVKASAGALKPPPQWNEFEIIAVGPRIFVKLNGKTVAQTAASQREVGYIGLEAEGVPFEVRNVRIRELGWQPLYNGLNLLGWTTRAPGHWLAAANGILAYDGKGGDLNTSDPFTDYDLRLDWRIGDNKTESGVLYRGSGSAKALASIGSNPAGSGGAEGYRNDAAQPEAVRKAATPSKRADFPIGVWNHYDIRVRGNTVNLWLNGEPILQNAALPGMPTKGPIGFQSHGSPVWFRNIEIRQVGKPAATGVKPAVKPGASTTRPKPKASSSKSKKAARKK